MSVCVCVHTQVHTCGRRDRVDHFFTYIHSNTHNRFNEAMLPMHYIICMVSEAG